MKLRKADLFTTIQAYQTSPRILSVGMFVLALLFWPAVCIASLPAVSTDDGDAFVTSSIAEPTNLIPFLAADAPSHEITALIFNGLVKYDKDLKLVGDLAERWEISQDGLVITFFLRKNVRWQDGTPFTAADVEFTFLKLSDPALPNPYGADFEDVRSVRATDPYTVRVEYARPFSPGLASWGMGMLPKHLLEHEDLRQTDFARHPVGTGPYRLQEWETGQYLRLSANLDYFEGRPHIDQYVYRIIPDQATNFLELQTEGLDETALTPVQYQRQSDSDFLRRAYRKFRYPSFAYLYLGYNLRDPLFEDARVRKAIGLAIDKNEIIRSVLLGLGRVSTGPFLPGTWAYDAEVPASVFDPARAKRLLAEAGWTDSDGDGRIDKDGRPFVFTVLTNQGNDQRRMSCELIQKDLKRIGIDMKIQMVEWGTFLKEFVDTKKFQAVVLAWQLSQDPDIYQIFHSSKTGPGEFNFISYRNEEVDRLLEEGRRVFSEEDRAKIYHRVHRLIAEDEPYTFLYVPEALPIVHRRFRGVEPAPVGIGYNFIRWSVDPAERRYKIAIKD